MAKRVQRMVPNVPKRALSTARGRETERKERENGRRALSRRSLVDFCTRPESKSFSATRVARVLNSSPAVVALPLDGPMEREERKLSPKNPYVPR